MRYLITRPGFRKLCLIAAALLLVMTSPLLQAASPDIVRTHKDSKGWKLKVNGEDFFVKGVVWGYSPRYENFTYNLWGKSDDYIKKVLDHDFGLMKKAGVNAIRSFATIPPEWITYIDDKYGIKTAINPLMGRYGANIGGKWVENPDYSDPLTRQTLKKEALDTVKKYKDVPGVLMFALGNESNYGLSWRSFEIENLPVGEQETEKAKYLYSLFAETITEAQKINPNHPITIVNGDIQYLDLMSKYAKDWNLLGVNAYRGKTFTDLWKDVKQGPDVPVIFFEFGSDAFNAKEFREDQRAQADYLRRQWIDMYNNSYGRGYGNSIGGFVFEWRDEWWKYKQDENLDQQDYNASWENGGYEFDHVAGKANMNEEWFGITRLGDVDRDGVHTAQPRMAYDVLAEVWAVDPYAQSQREIDASLESIDMEALALMSRERDQAAGWSEKPKAFEFTGGEVILDFLSKGYDTVSPYPGNGRVENDDGEMVFLDFAFHPVKNFWGDFTINIIANASDSDFEFKYGDRVNPVGIADETNTSDHIEIYDFRATYIGEGFDVNAFYHVPRYHWGYEGDFFGLLRETTDMEGQDIWNAKAPYGVEFVGKDRLDGLKVVAGPEIYWGANPKVLLKYQFGENQQYTFIHSEDVDERSGGESSTTDTTSRKTRQTTVQGTFELGNGMTLDIGGIMSGTEKIGDKFDYVSNGQIYVDEVNFEDTLGLKARLSFDLMQNALAYVGFNYAGLVANGGEPLRENGTELPYSEYGNKRVLETGVLITHGDYTIFPRLMYRDNILDANPLIPPSINGTTLTPGIVPRNTDDDPFAVLDNREARSAEIFLTYDPTPATYFYAWDNDEREDAKFAYNIGLTYTRYPTATDSELFYFEPQGRNVPFGTGLEADDVWLLTSKMVFNPSSSFKAILKLEFGKQQPTGVPESATEYASLESKFIIKDQNIVYFKFVKDGWGPYDFQRQFDVKYPEQYELEYVRLLNKGLPEKYSSKVGIKALYRTLDGDSPEYLGGLNDYMYEFQTYISYRF
ncbi:MAG: glycoside hydrolase family 2 TIM barrel-domain containing protein [Chromatiales bacterium]|jgi:hypothetical protein